MHIFITRPLPDIACQLLDEAQITYTIWEQPVPPTAEDMIRECLHADGILNAGSFKYDEPLLQALAHIKVISMMSVGFDHIDVEAAKKLGIKVGNTPDVLSNATADTAFLLLLATSRKAFHHHKRMLDGSWRMFQPLEGLGIELYGKTLGVFGLGKIGYQMARKCQMTYQMKIIYHNRSRNEQAERDLGATYVSLDEMLRSSDVITVHSALTEQTRGTFDRMAFQKMKPEAIFINTGRGGLHVEPDLIAALQNHEIWGAGLDVFEKEPTPVTNPLLMMENVCSLPHIGSATVEARTAMARLATQNLIAALKNEKMPSPVC